MQSIDSTKTYSYGTNKETIQKKRIQRMYQYNVTIQWLTMTILQKKT